MAAPKPVKAFTCLLFKVVVEILQQLNSSQHEDDVLWVNKNAETGNHIPAQWSKRRLNFGTVGWEAQSAPAAQIEALAALQQESAVVCKHPILESSFGPTTQRHPPLA